MAANPVADLLDTKVVALPTQGPAKADLPRLRRFFEEARDLTTEARTEALKDSSYYDGPGQWTGDERIALASRNQPDTVFNRIKPAVNGMVGVIEKGRSDPRAFPRAPDDDETADVATDVLRYIADKNRLHRLKADCFLDMLVPGSMAAIVGANGDLDVEITQIRWEEFFADPRSRRRDFKDARYLGIAKWMYGDDVTALYPDKKPEIESAMDAGGMGSSDASFQDRPQGGATGSWADKRLRRLLIVEVYYREAGKWLRCVYHGSGILEEGESPYLDEKGRPDCPIEAQSAYVDKDNNRYGVVRDMRGPQDEINKRRSKLLHLLSVSQIEVADPSAIEIDADVARAEAARPDGVIPYGWRKVSTADMATGQALLLAEAKGEIERMGPNPAVLGRSGEDSSGRAQLIRQQAGMVELALLFGGLEDWELRIYRQCWARAKQYWRAAQFIRVTDDQDAPKFVGINQPVHEEAPVLDETGQPVPHPKTGEPLTRKVLYPVANDNGQPQLDPATGQPAMAPKVLGYKNAMAEMDVDIILDTTPDTGTLRQEQFSELAQLLSSNPMWAQGVSLEIMLELSSIPHKRQLIDRIKKAREEAQQAQAEAQARAQKIAEAAAIAEIEHKGSQTELNKAKAGAATVGAISDAHAAHADYAIAGFEAGHGSVSQPVTPEEQAAAGQP